MNDQSSYARRILLSAPNRSGRERELIDEVLASGFLAPAGPMLQRFEQDFSNITGIPHACAVSTGTAALHLGLICAGFNHGDEVWAATLTFAGSVSAAYHGGAKLTFFDCSPDSWCLDPDLLAEELRSAARRGKLPRAVMPTDLYGQSCDLDRIVSECNAYGVPVVSDSAEAIGTRYRGRHAGDGASVACFSFNGNKIITTGNGGMVASHDSKIVERARYLSQQARQPAVHYEHTEIGFNYRLSAILAAVGVAQLTSLESRVARRQEIFARYRTRLQELPGVSWMAEAAYGRHTRWLSVFLFDPALFGADRETVRLALEASNIESRPVWKPMHLQPVFTGVRQVGGAVAEHYFAHGLCLPSGADMSDDDVDRIADIIARCAGSGG
jgi:dTDP-4-amino-4,6-dideoxygalactose transaminase